MARVTYIARAGLAPAHAAGSTYSLDFRLQAAGRPTAGALSQTQKSMSGRVEIQYYGNERIWSPVLAPMPINEAALIYEFLLSTIQGDQFVFDPYGTVSRSVLPLTVVRADQGFIESPFLMTGEGGLTDWVTLSFQAREQ